MIYSWPTTDGKQARQWAKKYLNGPKRDFALQEIGRKEAHLHQGTADTLISHFKKMDATEQRHAGRSLVEGMPEPEVAKALEKATKLSSNRDALMVPLLTKFATIDPQGTRDYFEEEEAMSPVWRNGSEDAFKAMVPHDAPAAFDWACKDLTGIPQMVALDVIVRHWAKTDPETVGALVLAMQDLDRAQEQAIQNLVRKWDYDQPAKARAWMLALPEGALSDRALGDLLKYIDRLQSGDDD